MPAPRRWTILIVPSDNTGTRSFEVDERAWKAVRWVAGISAFVVVSALVVLFTPLGTPAARVLLAENRRLHARLADIDARVMALNDTLAAIGLREQQMKLFAGLPTDSTRGADSVTVASASGRLGSSIAAGGRKPFAGRLGWTRQPDIDSMIARAAELALSFRAVSDTLTRNFERMSNTPSIMPTTGWLTSHFTQSRFHPVLHENLPHEGIDVSAPMGAPIVAPASGRVVSVAVQSGYGNTLQIDHGNGIVTRFAHCSRILVHEGQLVTRGQLIAAVGNTGLSTGPHLHYEVHVNGKPVDPLKYVLPEKIAD